MVAFKDCDIAILIASMPHLPGMERRDLLRANNRIFRGTGVALDKVAKRNIKVLVVANPCNTNALVTIKYAKSLNPGQFTGLSFLDHNRTTAQVNLLVVVDVTLVKCDRLWQIFQLFRLQGSFQPIQIT